MEWTKKVVNDLECKSAVANDAEYIIVPYAKGRFAVCENDLVISSSFTKEKQACEWVELNVKCGKTFIERKESKTDERKRTATKTMFTVTHAGKRDFRIMFGESFVSAHGTNAAAQKRADQYNERIEEIRENDGSVLEYIKELQDEVS